MTPYERVLADPGLRARYLRAYAGVADPLDALWWLDHPGEPGPSGAPSREPELDGLRRLVYAPGERDDDARQRYRRLEAAVRGDERAASAALVAAGAAPLGTRQEPPVREEVRPARRRVAWLPAAAIALLVVAFLAGFALTAGGRPPAPAGSAAAFPTLPPLPDVGSGALTVLKHPPLSIDRPGIPVGDRLIETSFRLVDSGALASLYIARTIGGQVCLVAVTVDRQFAATCVAPARVVRMPLELRFTVATTDPGDRVAVLAVLHPDGQAELRAP